VKVLVVEDNDTGRSVLKRVLSHLGADIIEASDGLDGLVRLEKDDPDLLVLDLSMPVLDGFEVLGMVRSSPQYANLPIIIMTGTAGERDVRRLASLGVADLLIKTLKPELVHDRIKKVVLSAGGWRQRKVLGHGDARERLLLVERDPNFRAFARPMLETRFDVVEVASGAEAVSMFRHNEWRPHVLCVGEGLSLVRERRVAELVRDAAVEMDVVPPRLYLMATNPDDPEHAQARWDGIIRKTFVPQSFKESFEKVAVSSADPAERLQSLVREEMREELQSAVQQTVGVMTGQDLGTLEDAAAAEVPAEALATVRLAGPSLGLAVDVHLMTGRTQVEQLGARVLRRPVTFDAGGSEVFGELANTVAGRLRASLGPRGYVLHLETPQVRVLVAAAERPRWLTTLAFETAAGERLALGVSLAEIEKVAGEAPVGEAAAEPAAAAGGAVDDVLF
jgi:CheY-like chemotaxis protein